MNEEKAAAIMMANLKGSKNKPTNLVEFAEACRFLINKWGLKEMSRYFRVSEYMLRQIDKINELGPKLKKLTSTRKLGIEASYQLSRIEEPKRSQVANIIMDMTTYDIRRFVYFIVKNPTMSITQCKRLFEKEKPEKVRLLVLPLDSNTYNHLQKLADHSKHTIHDYALKILKKGLDVK